MAKKVQPSHIGRYHVRSSWPAYIQERDTTPVIYRTGVLHDWIRDYKEKQLDNDNDKALSILNEILNGV